MAWIKNVQNVVIRNQMIKIRVNLRFSFFRSFMALVTLSIFIILIDISSTYNGQCYTLKWINNNENIMVILLFIIETIIFTIDVVQKEGSNQ